MLEGAGDVWQTTIEGSGRITCCHIQIYAVYRFPVTS